MGSPCLFTRQQSLKLGYFYWLRVKHANPLLTDLFVLEILVSPLSEFEQHMYSSDPRPDTGSLNHCRVRDHADFFHFLGFR